MKVSGGGEAMGWPSRDPQLDVLPGFREPPAGYGQVAFFWWVGDPLTRERLLWQLERLSECRGTMGLQINYAHGYRDGGISYGLTIPSDPPLFSEAWWELVDWFKGEANRRGMAISLSDYTLAIGQGWCVDELLAADPELRGSVLRHHVRDVDHGDVEWALPLVPLMVAAWPLEGEEIVAGEGMDLRAAVEGGVLRWQASGSRRHRIIAVVAERVAASFDPLHPEGGKRYAELFFGQFERRYPGEGGKGLNFFFSDELIFGVEGNLWNDHLAEEFRRRKGYDLVPELPALFVDDGARTPKVRLDYRDVMVALAEEGFFRPVFDWHQKRGMIHGCDHGGRGRHVVEFGDYFRAMRWNQGPGCDQPKLHIDLIKNKVASSIAHLYERPRVWLEGYYSSGWGTSTEMLVRATFTCFAQGQNMLSLHGLYYSTHGGYWEWAPPCNHFRMPYWPHMDAFLTMVERLSYLLSQGRHCCDVAIVYPVAAVEAGLGGAEAVATAFAAGEWLYAHGIDFDFIDFESVERATAAEGALRVSGECYRVLVLPGMRAVRWSTLRQALALQQAGGMVALVGAVPEASDRAGRDDPELDALVAHLTTRVAGAEELGAVISEAVPRDFAVLAPEGVSPNFLHRRIGDREIYLVHGAPQGAECSFRATGRVELWDPWTGERQALPVIEQAAGRTRLRLPLGEAEANLIVFSPGVAEVETTVEPPAVQLHALDGNWEFELKPTMDNRFGDFRWPPTPTTIGPEGRRFRHAEERGSREGWERPEYDDSFWPEVTQDFGPQFWLLGPLPDEIDLDESLSKLSHLDPAIPVMAGGRAWCWQPYAFSWRWGVEGDPGVQGYHGLKSRVTDDFIALGIRRHLAPTGHFEYVADPAGSRYYLWTTAAAPTAMPCDLLTGGNRPTGIWLNGQRVLSFDQPVMLRAGANPLLLRYDGPGRGHVVVRKTGMAAAEVDPGGLAMRWHLDGGVVPYDVYPEAAAPAGWYRFMAPPGLLRMRVPTDGQVQAWIAGQRVEGIPVSSGWDFALESPWATPCQVALRIEQVRGAYGGATLTAPIAFDCGKGALPAGDWAVSGGLAAYSGGAWYRRRIVLEKVHAGGQLILDLGRVVATAEVHLNGRRVGVRVAPPWRFDLTDAVQEGENVLAILVYNTLANHYLTIPTCYRGEPVSGLLGPVTLERKQAGTR